MSASMNPFDTLAARGFIHQCTDEAALRAALDAGPITFYAGFDPSAPSLHVGSAVPLLAMSHLSRAGHRCIGVVGGGTMMVGDPSGRDATRELLTPEKIEVNKVGLRRQILQYAGGELVDNADWLLGLKYVEFLRDIGVHFSVNRMIASEGAKQRLDRDQGLSFIEFNYSLLQAYDFLELNRRYGCTLQIGGGDQWFNIVSGVDLIRRMGQGHAYGLTLPLLTTATGAKMGKTASGAVWLDPDLCSPYDFYQYWVNVHDDDVERFLKMFTYVDLAEVPAIVAGDIREAKRRLALEATTVIHGASAAHAAAEAARAAFSGGVAADMPSWHTTFPVQVVTALHGSGLAKSRGDARRLIEGGGVALGEHRVTDVNAVIDGDVVLWAGKKRAVHVVAEGTGS